MEYSGFAVALAWPQTYCKKPGSWYDFLTTCMKFREGNYYQVGHSAIILIDEIGQCKYYDFGRYHAPYQHGRVRSAETDFELEVQTKAKIKEAKVLNFKQILEEISNNESCHGDGDLHASYIPINFEKAQKTILKFKEKSCHKYGPFVLNGTNCSRFVQSVLLAGNHLNKKQYLKILISPALTSTPLQLVKALPNKEIIISEKAVKKPISTKENILSEPETKPHPKAKWFAGEGAGSWIVIFEDENHFRVEKYSDQLKLESISKMQVADNKILNTEENFDLQFPVHCEEVHLIQENQHIILLNKL